MSLLYPGEGCSSREEFIIVARVFSLSLPLSIDSSKTHSISSNASCGVALLAAKGVQDSAGQRPHRLLPLLLVGHTTKPRPLHARKCAGPVARGPLMRRRAPNSLRRPIGPHVAQHLDCVLCGRHSKGTLEFVACPRATFELASDNNADRLAPAANILRFCSGRWCESPRCFLSPPNHYRIVRLMLA